MLNDVTSVALHTALSGLSQRQRTIADNVANLGVPNYTAKKVQFETALRDAVDAAGGDPAVVRTAGAPTVTNSPEPAGLNGNNVNLDHETLSNVDTGLRYQLMLRALDGKISSLREAIRAGV